MSRLSSRLARVERAIGADDKPPIVVIVDPKRCSADAVAAYEAEHGSTEGCIRVVICAAQRKDPDG